MNDDNVKSLFKARLNRRINQLQQEIREMESSPFDTVKLLEEFEKHLEVGPTIHRLQARLLLARHRKNSKESAESTEDKDHPDKTD